MTNLIKKTKLLASLIISIIFLNKGISQTIRYQNSVRGGFAIAANGLVDDPTHAGSQKYGSPINTAGGTIVSSSSDLILPPGSTIIKSFLCVEGYVTTGILGTGGMQAITSVKFRVPGGAYTTLSTTSPGFITNSLTGGKYGRFIIEVTNLIPANGYITSVIAGGDPSNSGRYSLADVNPFVNNTENYGYGWALFVIYTNPSSKYRNVTIADAVSTQSSILTINNIQVPSSGIVNAVVAITGCYGDEKLSDYASFGRSGTTLTGLIDPTTGANDDILNSTIGFCSQNNVSADGGPAISGNYTTRNPYVYGAPNSTGNWYSYYYDCDIINAAGILPPSATPIAVNLTQQSGGDDLIGFGAYAISVDIVAACLSKSLSPTTIVPGGIATYTFTIDNTLVGALNLTGIGFTDNLPSGIVIASPSGASISGGTGGVVSATPGSTSLSLSGLNLNIGQTATMTVNITNAPGQTNPDCSSNPAAFTNSFSNILNNTANLVFCGTPQCLVVSAPALPLELLNFTGKNVNDAIHLTWASASEKNSSYFEIEYSNDGNVFTKIAQVPAAGNSTTIKNYSYSDLNTHNSAFGMLYYRLKQVDFNGDYSYSRIVSVNRAFSVQKAIINENPVKETLIIQMPNAIEEKHTAIIYNTLGAVVLSISIENQQTEISVGNLQAGVYFLSIINKDGTFIKNLKFGKEQ